jgi:site-specific DNA-methyltransferase (adenine-specific)
VLDFFGGSGTTGEAAARNGRGFVLIDDNPEAVQIAADRLASFRPALEGFSATPLVHAFTKKTQKTPARALDLARTRAKEIV